jgi:hypothetical protein
MPGHDQSGQPATRITRTKTVDVIPLGDGQYRLEGRLTDLSRGGNYGSAGPGGSGADGPPAASVIHDITLTAHVRGPELEVVDLDVQTLTIPYPSCPFVLPVLQRLVGQQLRSGWRRAVLELSGGTRGCTHVNTLLLSLSEMRTMVIFLKMNERVEHSAESRANGKWISAGFDIAPQLADGCYSLRRGGPVFATADVQPQVLGE